MDEVPLYHDMIHNMIPAALLGIIRLPPRRASRQAPVRVQEGRWGARVVRIALRAAGVVLGATCVVLGACVVIGATYVVIGALGFAGTVSFGAACVVLGATCAVLGALGYAGVVPCGAVLGNDCRSLCGAEHGTDLHKGVC